ncbi:hypothetical protein SAMN02745911_3623 [Aureimonas altamirensis DSM 21988]|jgi:hypothetical protein|uniref:Uncharacterized protein n=2 Tax=Aureimonas altamirensis TaxID=370622 RepID=A0A0P0YVK8_9HYPH|nr:hypothetical protein [Aureimonas altamirensis]BAT25403.1 hypothetical protein [Aureimonas altamirensis]BAT25522.1 hypothetical protein [Aureimonas altamirensis]SHI38457.1 hypothetical protein SAMN02745911_0009 [Aureimonas altamirensis DSM 21988]SHJ86120.1 hypothetical protein SAMN02745911_3623 [Aureimonas altamirensis DSM 21988]
MHVRFKTGEWRLIPGRLIETDDGCLLPVDAFTGIAHRIVPEDLLTIARKLVKTADQRRWQVRQTHLNRMRLELAKECLTHVLADWEVTYY